jgi:hypothetical protein
VENLQSGRGGSRFCFRKPRYNFLKFIQKG